MPVAVLLALSAAASSHALPPSHYALRVPGRTVTVTLSEDRFTGPETQLTRERDTLRGSAFGRAVSLKSQPGRVTGLVGAGPVQLHVAKIVDGIEAVGPFAGQLSRLKVGPRAVSGRVGLCSYELTSRGAGYEGWRTCGTQQPQRTTLSLPPRANEESVEARLAFLAVLLAQ